MPNRVGVPRPVHDKTEKSEEDSDYRYDENNSCRTISVFVGQQGTSKNTHVFFF